MLNLTQRTLVKIKNSLSRQQKEVDQQIKAIEQDDPMMYQAVAESSESGTDSWQADVHTRVVTVKNDLVELSQKIKNSLGKISRGTYGKCEKCGKTIEAERLEAMPTASLCVACSKK